MTHTILIADDHTLVRAGVRSLLERVRPDFTILEAADGGEALRLVEESHPDIALMDITMPGLNGLEATRRLRKNCPECRIIMLSMHQDEAQIVSAMQAGAQGYLLKDAAVAELSQAIDAVMAGDVYLSRDVPKTVAAVLAKPCADPNPLMRLSSRQREILQRIAEGQSTKEIGYDLNLSVKTVETHRRELMDRLGIHDVASLTRFALRSGLAIADR